MHLILKATGLDITPSLQAFIEKKLLPLGRLVKRFDLEGAVELRVEIARTTVHHRKGAVYYAEANMRLPGKILRAEEQAEDVRVSIDRMRHVLKLEVEKYRAQALESTRRSR